MNSDIFNNLEENSEVEVIDELKIIDKSELIVYNDDINTFDWVIRCFMEVCNHTQVQSEQLSLIVHFKGKAVVKTGDFDKLKPMKDALIDRGLSAAIETYKEKH